MSVKRRIAAALFLLFVGGLKIAAACSCLNISSPCGEYAGAAAVIVGSVQRVQPDAPGDEAYQGGQTAYVHVERAFKGEVGDALTLLQPGDNCTPKFKPGDRWLMYVSFDKEGRTWRVHGCGRSGPVEHSGNDLRYLRGLPDSATRTRISGEIGRFEEDPEEGLKRVGPIAGVKVRVKGEAKTYEAATDADGIYEFNDLPPGKYSLAFEPPPGLKLRFPVPFGPRAPRGGKAEPNAIALELKQNDCAGSDFLLSSDTLVGGRVLGADGEPMPRVCLKLTPADKVADRYFRIFDCTGADGGYSMKEIPPGRYLIVVNDDGKLSGDEPFPTAYYPGVFRREEAGVVTVGEGEKNEGLDIRLPALSPTRTISGVLRYSDGQPANGFIHFTVERGEKGYEIEASTMSDEEGRFSLKVLRDVAGSVSGGIYASGEQAARCPELKKALAGKPGHDGAVKTKPARVAAGAERNEVVLTFPFPHCPGGEERN